jgi:amino acid transporter
MMLKRVERPRELTFWQAGAMLYGDWGTSKAYVLGIAFALGGHASWFFLGLMSALTALVGFCYTIICKCYPDGGGVYSSVKQKSQFLAVIGAFLLVADYVMTACLSALSAFQYFAVPRPELWAIAAIFVIGVLNWIGPSKGGNIAFVIALAASAVAGILFLSTVPSLFHVELSWPQGDWKENWASFVGIVLALSGVEAIANMTGIMKHPVEKTSRLAIWPVLLEVSVLTFLLGMAMNAIPGLTGHTEDMLRALGSHYIGPWYGYLVSVVFGFLLLSAANTAVGSMVSIQYLMSRDKELPPVFARLNRFGMPWLALLVAVFVPCLVLILEHDLVHLAALYAIGVVGAITLNLGSTATNPDVPLRRWERFLLSVSTLILFAIEITIAFEKHNALIFALAVLGTGLSLRFVAKAVAAAVPAVELPEVNVLTVTEAKEIAPLYKSSTLVGLKTVNRHLLDEAVLRAKALEENSVYLSYVEESPPPIDTPWEIEPSRESLEVLGKAQKLLEEKGLTAVPVWQLGTDPGKLIAQAARELSVNTVMIGTTRRSALVNLIRGEILRSLARNLPSECHLVISG